ncbi:mannose-6-phosphate isomerase, type 1 [Caldanaerobius fijiensis DSM 17918]|uniref:Phosphohexomutase n=1 Tax=Caldanaerobius fijiensis DSM 17918 TaxID=1121256 RepID=A0A1M4Y884_9THEO|nr:mannose-6-phosphate isomerase, type 1 [Caldanaerobius fijiensis DSM 17918]
MYPLKFFPIYMERIWGGNDLKRLFGRDFRSDKVGESWEVACHPHGTSIVSNGELKGKNFQEIINTYGRKILGNKLSQQDIEKFPLLIKLLDANDILSVQVHPDDEYAMKNENGELGKCEMWYVISAKPGAKIIYGLKDGVTKDEFKKALREGSVERCLNEVEVMPGDVFDVPSGMIHALGAGVVVAEIQQNSDTVYRVYDWNRVGLDGKPRELHVQKALDVIDFDGKYKAEKSRGLKVSNKTYLVANKHFAVELIPVNGKYEDIADGGKFSIYTIISGNGSISFDGKEVDFKAGDSVFIPASLGKYSINGSGINMLKSYVPDIEQEVIQPLKSVGYSDKEIRSVVKKIS